MSFDLILFPGEGRRLEREEVRAYFENQNHVECTEDRVAYSNDDTGVYFTLGFSERDDVDPNDPSTMGRTRNSIFFEMNFMRPCFFALEASHVLSRLAEHFALHAEDPQSEGMASGAFDADDFVRSWTGSNRWACQAMRHLGSANRLTLRRALNEALWHWNYYRDDISEHLQDEMIGTFVPLVMFFREDDQVRTFCIFPNLVPTTVPKVDRIVITRDQLPTPYAENSNPAPAWVTWDELVAAMPGYEIRGKEVGREEHPHLILFDEDGYQSPETAPKELAFWVIGLPDWPGRPEITSPDQILDVEMMEPVDGV